MKLTHERKELVAVDGCLDVKVEAVLELALGDLAAQQHIYTYTTTYYTHIIPEITQNTHTRAINRHLAII